MRRRRCWAVVTSLALIGAACTAAESPTDDAAGGSFSDSCALAAETIVARFDAFLEPFSDLSPAEFLDRPELAGLEEFQNDVAAAIVEVVRDPNDDCTEADLEEVVDESLARYSNQGLLQQYLVGTVRAGVDIERRDVSVTPADDLLAILPFLGPGSTVQLSEGTFTLDATLLVQSEVVFVGAGRNVTFLDSTAPDAAAAVLADGHLILSEMTVRHVGDAPASVLLAIDAPLTLQDVTVSGAVADVEGGGGSGIVVTSSSTAGSGAGDAPTDAPTGEGSQSSISNSEIVGNASAGIAVTGNKAPAIFDSHVEGNGQCGICYFDGGSGTVSTTTLEGNGIGIQVSDRSSVEIFDNVFLRNDVAGVLIEDASTVLVVSNTFDSPETVGIDVQGTATPTIRENSFGPHAVAISIRGESKATVETNVIEGGEVGLLVGGSASPSVSGNDVAATEVSAFLHVQTAGGTFTTNTVAPAEGAAVVVEGDASPTYVDNTFNGGAVGLVFRERGGGNFRENQFEGQEVAIEAGDDAAPELVRNTVVGSTAAGLIFSGQAAGEVRENRFVEQTVIAIQTGGSATPLIEDNEVEGGDTGVLITETSSPRLVGNSFIGQNFAIGVSGSATPEIVENEIEGARAGAISFEGESGGQVTANTITEAGVVGIRIAGSARPVIDGNRLFAALPNSATTGVPTPTPASGAASESQPPDQSGVGVLYVEQATGMSSNNQIFGFVIGMQVSDTAAPELLMNRIDGAAVGGVGILYAGGSGRAEGNKSTNQQLGFQLSGTSSPELIDNTVGLVGAAAYLIQGSSTAVLRGNDCRSDRPGIAILAPAAPELSDNSCAVVP